MPGDSRAAALGASHTMPWTLDSPGAATVPTVEHVQDVMWQDVGLSRDEAGLTRANGLLQSWRRGVSSARQRQPFDHGVRRLGSIVTVGALIAHAALRRQESRGGHFRTDFPQRDDLHWQRRVADVRQPAHTPEAARVAVAVP
jgi:L-aspartate oxidase